jgi:hypothetical protein
MDPECLGTEVVIRRMTPLMTIALHLVKTLLGYHKPVDTT